MRPRQTLLYAGKEELITSALQGIESLWLSILPLPQALLIASITFADPSCGLVSTPSMEEHV